MSFENPYGPSRYGWQQAFEGCECKEECFQRKRDLSKTCRAHGNVWKWRFKVGRDTRGVRKGRRPHDAGTETANELKTKLVAGSVQAYPSRSSCC